MTKGWRSYSKVAEEAAELGEVAAVDKGQKAIAPEEEAQEQTM